LTDALYPQMIWAVSMRFSSRQRERRAIVRGLRGRLDIETPIETVCARDVRLTTAGLADCFVA
jgi:hypothetical protein